MKRVIWLLLAFGITACEVTTTQNETAIIPNAVKVTNSNTQLVTNSSNLGHILGALVTGQSCGAPSYGNLYTLYVTSATRVNYGREIHIGIIDEQNRVPVVIETEILTIPANQYTSANVPVFYSPEPSGPLGQVKIRIFAVKANGQDVTDNWELPIQNPTVNNCYNESGLGDGYFGRGDSLNCREFGCS